VQKAVIGDVCEKIEALEPKPELIRGFVYEPIHRYMTLNQYNQAQPSQGKPRTFVSRDTRKIVEAKSALLGA